MSNYSINGNDIYSTYGVIPSAIDDSDYAVSGMFDIPPRDGDTEHDWGNETETFLDAEDIVFKGREINFEGHIKGSTYAALISSVNTFLSAITSGSFIFATQFGSFTVYVKGSISVKTFKNELLSTIRFTMYQPDVAFTATLPATLGSLGSKIDDYGLFQNFGIHIENRPGQFDLPERIEIQTTDFYPVTQYRKLKYMEIKGFVEASGFSDLTTKMQRFQRLLTNPGSKVFTFSDNTTFTFYVRDGLTVTSIRKNGSQLIASFNLKIREANP